MLVGCEGVLAQTTQLDASLLQPPSVVAEGRTGDGHPATIQKLRSGATGTTEMLYRHVFGGEDQDKRNVSEGRFPRKPPPHVSQINGFN